MTDRLEQIKQSIQASEDRTMPESVQSDLEWAIAEIERLRAKDEQKLQFQYVFCLTSSGFLGVKPVWRQLLAITTDAHPYNFLQEALKKHYALNEKEGVQSNETHVHIMPSGDLVNFMLTDAKALIWASELEQK